MTRRQISFAACLFPDPYEVRNQLKNEQRFTTCSSSSSSVKDDDVFLLPKDFDLAVLPHITRHLSPTEASVFLDNHLTVQQIQLLKRTFVMEKIEKGFTAPCERSPFSDEFICSTEGHAICLKHEQYDETVRKMEQSVATTSSIGMIKGFMKIWKTMTWYGRHLPKLRKSWHANNYSNVFLREVVQSSKFSMIYNYFMYYTMLSGDVCFLEKLKTDFQMNFTHYDLMIAIACRSKHQCLEFLYREVAVNSGQVILLCPSSYANDPFFIQAHDLVGFALICVRQDCDQTLRLVESILALENRDLNNSDFYNMIRASQFELFNRYAAWFHFFQDPFEKCKVSNVESYWKFETSTIPFFLNQGFSIRKLLESIALCGHDQTGWRYRTNNSPRVMMYSDVFYAFQDYIYLSNYLPILNDLFKIYPAKNTERELKYAAVNAMLCQPIRDDQTIEQQEEQKMKMQEIKQFSRKCFYMEFY